MTPQRSKNGASSSSFKYTWRRMVLPGTLSATMTATNAQRESAQLETEKQACFRGTARVEFRCLVFPSQRTRDRNVQGLVQKFQREGCLHQDPRYRLHATVTQDQLTAAMHGSRLTLQDLRRCSADAPVPRLNFEGPAVRCLHGWRRVAAAAKVLRPDCQWWLVELYSDGKWPLCRRKDVVTLPKTFRASSRACFVTNTFTSKVIPTDKSSANSAAILFWANPSQQLAGSIGFPVTSR